jgi:hypothetical protein
MNSSRSLRRLALGAGSLGVATAGLAQPAQLPELDPGAGFFFRVGGTVRTGVKAEFRDVAPAVPTAAGVYENGYVLPSVTGAASDYTWNWGYDDAAQVGADTLNFSRLNDAPRVGALSSDGESMFGGELVAGFEIYQFELARKPLRFGVEAAYSFMTFSASAAGSASGTATLTQAGYSTIGPGGVAIVVPPAPYAGTFDGPGPLLGRTPATLTTISAPGASALDLTLDATIHTLKFGPYFAWDLTKRLSLAASFGYATVLPDAEMTFRETTTYGAGTGGTIPSSAIDAVVRRSDWQPGGFVQFRLEYHFTRRLSAFVGAEYLYNENLVFQGQGREATIKLGGTYGGTLGVGYHF